ncbi:MAG TPA: hypothetical protein ENI56_01640 [Candidatus Kaiserbacteria bacterium]|nr:hypothetical protein [Candidatus Kaiserbacteria bacterium]
MCTHVMQGVMCYTIFIMVITYHGGQCIKVSCGDTSLVFDPISKNATLPAVKFGADIALVSRNHPDMNGINEVSYGGKEPFVIDGPGEYEYKNVLMRGYFSQSMYGVSAQENTREKKTAVNTIYAVELEGMTLVHLGALSSKELPHEMREAVNDIDVLFIPITGNGVLSAEDAYELATSLEPHVIIPLYKSGTGASDALEHFLREEGTSASHMNKVTLKKKEVLEQSSAMMVLQV